MKQINIYKQLLDIQEFVNKKSSSNNKLNYMDNVLKAKVTLSYFNVRPPYFFYGNLVQNFQIPMNKIEDIKFINGNIHILMKQKFEVVISEKW